MTGDIATRVRPPHPGARAQPVAPLPNVLTVEEFCKLTRLSHDHVWALCKAGKIPGADKYRGRWLIPRASLPTVCVPVPPPEDATDHKRRAAGAADRLAAM